MAPAVADPVVSARPPARTTTAALVIVTTLYVVPRREAPFYELIAHPNGDLTAKPWPFITRDERLWEEAVVLWAAAVRVAITWHHAKRPTGQAVRVATQLTRETESSDAR